MALHHVWQPYQLKHLRLKNRIVSTSHSPGYAEDFKPKERYQLYHEEKAKGGIAMTMFGGSSVVSYDSAPSFGQIAVCDDSIIPCFQEFSDRIHRHDTAIMCQLSHMGRRTHWDTGAWMVPVSPGVQPEPAHHSFSRPLEKEDIARIRSDFAKAVLRCRKGGLDGCELFVSGHLHGQFWSPAINERTDEYNGTVRDRLRFTLETLQEIRERAGDYIVGLRFSADEMIAGGIDAEQTAEIAGILAESGLVDFFNLTSSHNWTAIGLSRSVPSMAYPSLAAESVVRRIRAATAMPIIHATRINDLATAEYALQSGLVDLVGMTRAHIADPHHVAKHQAGHESKIRPCVGAAYCIDRIYRGADALCIHNASTGREASLPQTIARALRKRRVLVVGAGIAGLEAARICAERGHNVAVWEAASEAGGQVLLAARATWRKEIIGIVAWRIDQLAELGVRIQFNRYAEAAEVQAEAPDVVILATGGLPNLGFFEGHQLAVSTWDVLNGSVKPAASAILYDDHGQTQGLSTAEFMAAANCDLEFITPERQVGSGMGSSNFAVHLRNLYKAKVGMVVNHRLVSAERKGNRLRVAFRNEFDQGMLVRDVDQLVVERGTIADRSLFDALKPLSSNAGAFDTEAWYRNLPQQFEPSESGTFALYRIGDALASRNIHAAVYDAMRICKDL